MKPAVGRIVHYYRVGQFPVGPLAAIITKVWGPFMVNLRVFDGDMGTQMHQTSVEHKDNAHGSSQYWEWPPREEG